MVLVLTKTRPFRSSDCPCACCAVRTRGMCRSTRTPHRDLIPDLGHRVSFWMKYKAAACSHTRCMIVLPIGIALDLNVGRMWTCSLQGCPQCLRALSPRILAVGDPGQPRLRMKIGSVQLRLTKIKNTHICILAFIRCVANLSTRSNV